MYRPYYSKHNPPPVYYCLCGQMFQIRDVTVGYSTRNEYWVDGRIVRDCPGCGKRITFSHLLHPREWDEQQRYEDERDTVRSVEPVLR